MPTYKIEYEKAALKFIERQSKSQRLRLYKAIYKLPAEGDIKKLKGTGLYRLRVGDYRIIYSVDNGLKVINVENIDNRGDIYKRY